MQVRYGAKDLVEAQSHLRGYGEEELGPVVESIYRGFQGTVHPELVTDCLFRSDIFSDQEGAHNDVLFYVVNGKLVGMYLEPVGSNMGGPEPVEIVFDRDENGAERLLKELERYIREDISIDEDLIIRTVDEKPTENKGT